MKSRVLVIGGGKWQVPLVKYISESVGSVDLLDPNESCPASKYCEFQYLKDIRFIDELIPLMNKKKYDLVISDQSDLGIESATILSNKLNLPGNPLSTINYFNRKDLSREFAKTTGTRIPDFTSSDKCENILEWVVNLNKDVIVKPSDSQSSRGISKIYCPDFMGLDKAIKFAKENSRNGIVVIEEFVNGVELTVEGISQKRKHTTVAVSEKKHFRMGVASDLIYPANLDKKVLDRLIDINDHYVDSSPLINGITHAEYIYDAVNDEIYLIEIAFRGGGSNISSTIISWLIGKNIYNILMNTLLYDQNPISISMASDRAAILHFFEFNDGIIKTIKFKKDIKELNGVAEFELFVKEGQIIRGALDDSARHGYLIVTGSNREELLKTIETVEELIEIEYS